AQLNQIEVWVADVIGNDPAARAGPLHRSSEDGHPLRCQVVRNVLKTLHKETQVRRPRRRSLGLRLELLPSLVEIDLVRPEAQGSPAFRAKHLPRHAEDALIEVRRTFDR